MVEYVKKTITGYRPISKESDEEGTLVLMGKEDYQALLNRVYTAEEKVDQTIVKAEGDLQALRTELTEKMDEQCFAIQAKARQTVHESAELLASANTKIATLTAEKELFENKLAVAEQALDSALRVNRERSNATRGITPKKEHDGYIILNSQQWTQNYIVEEPEAGYEDRKEEWLRDNGRMKETRATKDVWKSTLQSPYDAALPFLLVKEKVEKDFLDKGILRDLGLKRWFQNGTDNDLHALLLLQNETPINGIYKIRFRRNFTSKLWEVELYSVYSLDISEKRWIK